MQQKYTLSLARAEQSTYSKERKNRFQVTPLLSFSASKNKKHKWDFGSISKLQLASELA